MHEVIVAMLLLSWAPPSAPPQEPEPNQPSDFRDYLDILHGAIGDQPKERVKKLLRKLYRKYTKQVAVSPIAKKLQFHGGIKVAMHSASEGDLRKAQERLNLTLRSEHLTGNVLSTILPTDIGDTSKIQKIFEDEKDAIANGETGSFIVRCNTSCSIYINERAEHDIRAVVGTSCERAESPDCSYAGDHRFELSPGQYRVLLVDSTKQHAPYSAKLHIEPQQSKRWTYPRKNKTPKLKPVLSRTDARALNDALQEYRRRSRGEKPSKSPDKRTKEFFALGYIMAEAEGLSEKLNEEFGEGLKEADWVDVVQDCAIGTFTSGALGIIGEAVMDETTDDAVEAIWKAATKPGKQRGAYKALLTLGAGLAGGAASSAAGGSDFDGYAFFFSVASSIVTMNMPPPANYAADITICIGSTYARPYVDDLIEWVLS